jgi:hypothetical protein
MIAAWVMEGLFVYPIEPPHQPDDWMRIVVEDRWVVGFADWQGAATTFAPWLESTGGNVAGAKCGTSDGYDHPDYPTAPVNPSDSPTGKPINPYVAGQTLTGKCENTTGT